MKKYLSIFRMNFIKGLAYRAAAISGIFTQLFWGLMHIMILIPFYKSGGDVGSFTMQSMITYTWLTQLSLALLYFGDTNKDISRKIENGDIAYELVKPLNLYNNWYSVVISGNISRFILCAPLVIIFAGFMNFAHIGLGAPISAGAFFLMLLSLTLGCFIMVAVKMIVYFLIMITLSAKGVFYFMVSLVDIMCGFVIPLPLMPDIVQKIFYYTPFPYIFDLPFRIYMGNIQITEGLTKIGIQFIWVIGLILVGQLLFKRKLKNVIIQGG